MIGRMRPFYQTHWDISKDIKHVWLLFCTYYIAWIFQWILGDEGRGEWWLHQVHRADRQHRVWTPQCAASWMLLLYARDSSRWLLTPGPQFLSRGAQTHWHRAYTVKQFQRLLGPMAAASNVIPFGLLYMRPLQWWLRTKGFSLRGNPFRMIKVTRQCFRERHSCQGLWKDQHLSWHFNRLEMLAVFLALNNFLADLRGPHVLVHSDNTSVVSYLNHQGVCGHVHFANWHVKSFCGPKGSCCFFEQLTSRGPTI